MPPPTPAPRRPSRGCRRISSARRCSRDVAASGYYATTSDNCDLTGNKVAGSTNDINWAGSDPGADCNMDARDPAVEHGGRRAGLHRRLRDQPHLQRARRSERGLRRRRHDADGVRAYKSGLSDGSSTRIGASYGTGAARRRRYSTTTGSRRGSAGPATPSASSRHSSSFEERVQHARPTFFDTSPPSS